MIIFLQGADEYRSREKVRELKRQYLFKNPDGTGLFEFDFDETGGTSTSDTRRAFFESLGTAGLFATKQFIIVRDTALATVDVRDSIAAFLVDHPDIAEKDSPTILLFREGKLPKKADKLFVFLDKAAPMKQSFDILTGKELERWAIAYLRSIAPETKITREALGTIVTETGSDLFRLSNELEKLAGLCAGGMITTEHVQALMPSERLQETVFMALDAVATGDRARALQLFAERIAADENALGLLALCAWQLRQIAQVSDAYFRQGLRTGNDIARMTGLKPFQVNKLVRRIVNFPLERVRRGFALLVDLDTQSKSGGTDPAMALELFVMKF